MFIITNRFLLLFALCSAVAPCLFAEQEEVTLDQVRTYGLLNGLEAKRIDTKFRAKLEDALQVKRLSNPNLNLSAGVPFSYAGDRPATEVSVGLSQQLRLSDFGLRESVSESLAEISSSDKHFELQEYVQRVSLAYFRLWAILEERGHLEKLLHSAKRTLRYLEEGSQQGLTSPSDVQFTKANVLKLQADLVGSQSDISSAQVELTRLAAVNMQGKKLRRPLLGTLRPYHEMLAAARENTHSIGKRSQLQLKLAKRQHDLAKRDRIPGITPQLNYYQNDADSDFIGFGLTIPLPLFESNQSEVQKRGAEKNLQLRYTQYIAGEEFEVEFRTLYEQAKAKVAQATAYNTEVLPAMRQGVTLSEKAFENAQLSLLDLLAVKLRYHETIDQSTRLWVEAFARVTELSLLTGELEV